jgi:nucleotide-binding universal stress UspA family protein
MYRSVVVGTDSSERARRAVEYASRLVDGSGGGLHIVCAVRVGVQASAAHDSAELAAFETSVERITGARRMSLESTADKYRKRGLSTRVHVHCGDPAAALMDVADEVGADVIVVGNRGLNGLRRLLGSVPGHLARTSSLPVLVVNTAGVVKELQPTRPE